MIFACILGMLLGFNIGLVRWIIGLRRELKETRMVRDSLFDACLRRDRRDRLERQQEQPPRPQRPERPN